MKRLLFIAIVLCNFSLFAQGEIKITSKKCVPKKGFYLRLKNIVNDSRCPENTTCIWDGEVSVIVEIYKDRQLTEEKTLTFNSKNNEENSQWFSGFYQKKVKAMAVLPYPKQGVRVKLKKQHIRIVFEE